MNYMTRITRLHISTIVAIFFVSCLSNVPIYSQYYPNSFYYSCKIDSNLENSLFFRIENSNFLKNNEYFNDIVQGYTLIGYHLSPKLVYYPAKSAKLEVGVHLLKYSGIEKFTKVLPILSFHYKAGKSTEIILGTLEGTINHQMVDPLFDNEKFFTENIENGLQFLFDTKLYNGDIWINWQNFIFKDDNSQEIFTFGLSNRFFLNGKISKHSFSIPVNLLFVHHGGQINETSKPVTTRNNCAIGMNYTYKQDNSLLKYISLESLFVTYKDMSSTHLLPYISGYGIYSQAQLKAGLFDITLAHWFGDFYLSERGSTIYQTASTIYPSYKEPQRALITSRTYFEKEVIKGLHVGADFETFYDLYNFYFDYGYMFYINFNSNFLIKSFRKKQQ
jgi:hypothetical protein